jgi:protein-disulfide isomerase/uncharacterized membrane protein
MSKQNPSTPPVPALRLAISGVFLVIATVAAWMLALSTLGTTAIPGCGAGSPCMQAADSAWGRLPVLGLPISLVGAAYFTASLLSFLISLPRHTCPIMRTFWFIGAAISLLYLVVIPITGLWCWACIVVHVANIAFVLTIPRPAITANPTLRAAIPVAAGILTWIGTLYLLSSTYSQHKAAQEAARAEEARKSIDQIAAQTTQQSPSGSQPTSGSPKPEGSQAAPAPTAFAGRYVLGPEVARARIVLFTDLCCVQCRATSTELKTLIATYPQANLSIKHFPLCADCNRGATSTLHPRACDAAAAAEAVGSLGGTAAFWNAVDWIYARLGEFTPEQLATAAKDWGIDAATMREVLASALPLTNIRADVDEGLRIGVERTPTIFINGVELRGWETPGAIESAVAAAINAAPTATDAQADRPLDAAECALSQWRTASPITMTYRPALDPAFVKAAPVRIVIFGDYQDAFTAEADKILREYAQTWAGTLYQFRHFPANTQCNPAVKVNPHPMACRMARAVEAARIIGTEESRTAIHAWLFEHQRDYSDAGLRQLASSLGVDATMIVTAQRDARVQTAIAEDVTAGAALGITSLPAIFINERPLTIWKTEHGELLSKVLDEAAQASQEVPPTAR